MSIFPKSKTKLFVKSERKEGEKKYWTDEGKNEEEDIKRQAAVGGDEEVRDRSDRDYNSGDGGSERQLDGQDGVDLADESPPQIDALHHARVQRPGLPGLYVRLLLHSVEVEHACHQRRIDGSWIWLG